MQHPSFFSFCPHCSGGMMEFATDDVPRRKCTQCGWIQYRNPSVGVAVIIVEESRLLIGHRRDGGWCIPCGHVEWEESVEEAACREVGEETGLTVALHGIFAVKSNFHNPGQHTVGVWYRGSRTGGVLKAGGDLLEVDFVGLNELPDLRFPTDREVVHELRRDARHGDSSGESNKTTPDRHGTTALTDESL